MSCYLADDLVMAANNNLILGFCGGYKYRQVRPYLESLSRTLFIGDIVWFCCSVGEYDLKLIAKHNVLILSCSLSYPYFSIQHYRHHCHLNSGVIEEIFILQLFDIYSIIRSFTDLLLSIQKFCMLIREMLFSSLTHLTEIGNREFILL